MNSYKSIILVLFGFLTLLLSAFLDNIRGPLLLPMVKDLKLDLTDAGLFLGLGHAGAIVASIMMIRMQKRASDRVILLSSFGFSALLGFFAIMVWNRIGFWVLAFGCGFAITSMGIMCNILVVSGTSRRLLGKTLSGLHGMYGLGSFLGTFSVGQMLGKSLPWSTGFAIAGGIASIMLIATYIFFPRHIQSRGKSEVDSSGFRLAHLVVISAFAIYVGAEISVSMWMSPFLTEVKKLQPDIAAYYASLYFLVMSGSRILCVVVSHPRFEGALALTCLGASLVAFIYSYYIDYRFFPLTGLLGPFYPLLYSMMSRTFTRSWRLLASLINLGTHVLLGVINLSLGDIGKHFGVEKAYFAGPLLTVIAMVLLTVFLSKRQHFLEAT